MWNVNRNGHPAIDDLFDSTLSLMPLWRTCGNPAADASPGSRVDAGGEIFYIRPDGALMTVPVGVKGRFHAGSPVRLFALPIRTGRTALPHPYVVAPDARRVLVMSGVDAAGDPITVTLNWTSPLGSRK